MTINKLKELMWKDSFEKNAWQARGHRFDSGILRKNHLKKPLLMPLQSRALAVNQCRMLQIKK